MAISAYNSGLELPLSPRVAPGPEGLLAAQGLTVRYPGCMADALAGVDLRIMPGERLAVVGPSGGGKTTLLRALEGSLECSTGAVQRQGRAVLVYQDHRLVAEQSVLANVCGGALADLGLVGGLLRYPRKVSSAAMDILRDLGLANLARRRVGSLSGGQRQRVAIARALCAKPRVLLADEPLASLDPTNARRTLNLLAALQAKYGFALVLSIHDPGVAPDGFFGRYLLVRDGRLQDADWRDIRVHGGHGSGARAAPSVIAGENEPAAGDVPQDSCLTDASPWARRAGLAACVLALAAALAWSASALDLTGSSFAGALGGVADFLSKIVPTRVGEIWGLPWGTLGLALIETVQMSLLGTAMGIVVSLPLAVAGSRQTGPRAIRYVVRFILNLIRTVPSIFWALIFVACVGIGPVAGIFALAAYSVGYLTKFFYEHLEDVDERPVSALRALGASRLQLFCRAILPTARPGLIGACLFMLEYNIRAASVLGVVGAGGIGEKLKLYIDWRMFPEAATGLAMLLIVVIALDATSHAWRRHLTRQRGM